MSERKRLDVLVTERGLAASREKARALIMSGGVYVNGVREDKPGASFRDFDTLDIRLKGDGLRYVSRGGLKLEKALEAFDIELNGLTCIDIGASTGGFTDCMLQNGAARVYAVDVGHGQLDYKLRNDERVRVLEKTNVRYLEPEDIGGDRCDFAAADVSFISLKKVIPRLGPLLSRSAPAVLLIKPQFEAGRNEVGKNGVVRDKTLHLRVIEEVMDSALSYGFTPGGLSYSPIKGPKGNIEYLLMLKQGEEDALSPGEVRKVVDEAHEMLS